MCLAFLLENDKSITETIVTIFLVDQLNDQDFFNYLKEKNIFVFFSDQKRIHVSRMSNQRVKSLSQHNRTCMQCPQLGTHFLSVCVGAGESSAGCCSDALGGSDRESFSRDTGLSSLQDKTGKLKVTN